MTWSACAARPALTVRAWTHPFSSPVLGWDVPFFISRARMGRTLFHLPCQDGEFNREELFSSGSEAASLLLRADFGRGP